MIAKEGYIEYKHAYVVTTASHSALGTKKSVFDNVDLSYVMVVSASNGAVYFAQTSSDKVSNSDVVVGKIASMNPDDKTVTVYISPALVA